MILQILFHSLMNSSIKAYRIASDGTPHSVASHLGLCYLPMSHKKDARLMSDFSEKHFYNETINA